MNEHRSSNPEEASSNNPSQTSSFDTTDLVFKVGQLLAVLFLFLVSLNLMSGSFKLFGKGFAEDLLTLTSNPFVGLVVGMFATAIVQSSSMTTTIIVGLVASGSLGLVNAVPLVMGANVGTSVTSFIVSMGHIGNRKEFEKAISAASAHDFFNIISVTLMFIIEYFTHFLSSSANFLAQLVTPQDGEKVDSILFFVKDTAKWIIHMTGDNPYVALPIGLIALFISLNLLTRILKVLVIGKIQENMNKYVFGHPAFALLWGFGITTAVQSSSVTTSLMVPLVATEKTTLEKVFPFLMGANVGTTTTAIMAALFTDGETASAALAIAFAHLLFNLFGVLVLFPIPKVRAIPIFLAKELGRLTLKNRAYGVAFVVILFFIFPITMIYLTT